MYQKARLSPKQILDVLVDTGAIKRSASLSVQSFPGDVERRRGARRQLHRIWRDGRPRIQLYIAPDLNPLERRAAEIYQACPSIICKPLFFVKHDGLDFLGIEFAEGSNVEEAYAAQTLAPEALVQTLLDLDATLGQSEQASTSQAAVDELDSLLHALRESELLSDADQALLDSVIAQKLKDALLGPEPKTRWTNGDFITQNMIVGRRGAVIIDYEFAARTHFFDEDWARLLRYSPSLPAPVIDLVNERLGDRRTALDVYGLLRQIVLESRIKRLPELSRETGTIARQLVPLLDRWRAESGPSMFLPGPLDPSIPGNAKAQIQLFYTNTAEFTESNTIHDEVVEGVWRRIELPIPIGAGDWHIRLDPIHCPGVVDVASIDIHNASPSGAQAVPLTDLRASGTCAVAAVTPALTLISHGPDPQLFLPVVHVEGSGPLRLSVWIKWERLETGLGRAVDGMTRARATQIPVDEAAVRRAQMKVEELAADLQQHRTLYAGAETTIAELRASIEQLTAAKAEAQESSRELQARVVASAAQLSETEAALADERSAREQAEARLAGQARAQAQFEVLAHERQRIYDGGAVQAIARIREVTAKWTEERAEREAAQAAERSTRETLRQMERLAAESAERASWREAEARADVERLRAQHENTVRNEVAARTRVETLLESQIAGHRKAEDELTRSLADAKQAQRRLETEVRNRQEHERNLDKHVHSQQLRIDELERSISWKVTAPVRGVAKLFGLAPGRSK